MREQGLVRWGGPLSFWDGFRPPRPWLPSRGDAFRRQSCMASGRSSLAGCLPPTFPSRTSTLGYYGSNGSHTYKIYIVVEYTRYTAHMPPFLLFLCPSLPGLPWLPHLHMKRRGRGTGTSQASRIAFRASPRHSGVSSHSHPLPRRLRGLPGRLTRD